MKYRCLTYQEFEVLEADFSEFLHNHGFNFFEWKILQDQDSPTASDLLKKYSDLTFDKVMRMVECLQYRTPQKISTIYFKPDNYIKIDVEQENNLMIDLTQPSSLKQLDETIIEPFRIKKSINDYDKDREKKIFGFIESGFYEVSKNAFYHLDNLRKIQQN